MKRFIDTGRRSVRFGGCRKLSTDDSPSQAGTRTLFKLINNPPTIARLSVAPKIPIFIRQGCLVSLYNNGNNISDVSLTKQFINLWSNMIQYSSLKPSQFVKLVSSMHSFNALISTNNSLNKNLQTSLYHLNLSGEEDWQIWGKDSIVAYEQNTSLDLLPSRSLQFNKFINQNFIVLRGRGNLLLNGIGSIIKLDLKNPYDEILINYKNLLAISGKSQVDIRDSVTNQLMSQNKIKIEYIPIPSFKDEKTNSITIKSVVSLTKALIIRSSQYIRKLYDVTKYGTPTNFIKIKGPRTLLIQSFNNTILDNNSNYELEPLLPDEPMEKYISKEVKDDLANSNLSFAYVEPNGKVEFKKTLTLLDSK
ncbi:similar to Saccharomyces cerevisiae YJR080C AIM24 Protein of unknown function [Maudiozyma saulgeensis]|uniref:Altered inheritance of mitochondria protein 24, mitochondrial n=1 Tax=Maudiozyma saulgeensis TaxID=1789683 RepID=A0A1X7R6P1_9SACH|nr:similar to Saccharomyces cerevisiae YJR080C AIM24 Protein of unknown function [Kazachstania saulgeensis]